MVALSVGPDVISIPIPVPEPPRHSKPLRDIPPTLSIVMQFVFAVSCRIIVKPLSPFPEILCPEPGVNALEMLYVPVPK